MKSIPKNRRRLWWNRGDRVEVITKYRRGQTGTVVEILKGPNNNERYGVRMDQDITVTADFSSWELITMESAKGGK